MEFVTILNSAVEKNQASGTGLRGAEARLHVGPFSTDALILVSASGQAHYEGEAANAGVLLTINLNSTTVSQDDSFDDNAQNIDFRVSASHNFILKVGQETTVQARTDAMGEGGLSNNTQNRVTLQCFALATKSS